MNVSLRRIVPSLLWIVFISLVTIDAQDLDDVTFSGRIADSNNLAVVGATVTVMEIASGTTRTVTSNDEGRYRIIELKPGLYKIKVSATGFGAQEKVDIETISGQNVQLDFTLSPADVTASANVTVSEEDTPLVDTTRTVVGGTVTKREIEELPNSSRNPLDFVLTLGGTAEPPFATSDLAEDRNANNNPGPTEQGNFSLPGGASYSNNLTIDGLDNNDDRLANSRFQPSLEAIEEVQVIRNQFSAEYGRASGGRINLRTRAGTNRFRGRLFSFFRHDNWNANSYYNNYTFLNYVQTPSGPELRVSRAPLGRPDFFEFNPGFTFSGPVILPFGEGRSIYHGKDRTFFSIAYEYTNLRDTTLIDTYVPSGDRQNPRFQLPAATGTQVFCESQSTTTVGGVPTSNCNLAIPRATTVSPYRAVMSTPNMNHSFVARVDHRLTKTNDLTIGWQLGRRFNQRQNIGSTTRLEEALQGSTADTDAVNFTDNHVFGAHSVNQFRFQWSRYLPSLVTENPQKPVVLISYTNPLTNSGSTLIAGNSTSSNSARGLFADKRKENRLQFQNSLTFVVGQHTIKAGFDAQRVDSNNLDQFDTTGTYRFQNGTYPIPGATTPGPTTYAAMQNFLLNQVTQYTQNFDTSSEVNNTYWAVFYHDEFKLRPELTVGLGLRYERETVLGDKNNWGPRVGIAWDPFKKGRGVIRFGAGIFYNRVLLRTIDDFLISERQTLFNSNNIGNASVRLNALRAISANFPNSFPSAQAIRDLLVANGYSPNAGFTGVDTAFQRLVDVDTLKLPESYQFNIGFERQIGKGFVFEANYTWNKTARLWREFNPNAPRIPSGYTDLNDYLVRCSQSGTAATCPFLSGPIRFENAGVSAPDSRPSGGLTFVNLNSANPSEASSSPIGLALAAVDSLRQNSTIDQQEQLASIGNSKYQGLVLETRSRFKKFGAGFGGTFRVAYTLSSTKDDGIVNTSDAEINGDFSREWARSLQDRRHRVAVTGTFDTPFWLGRIKFSPLFRYGSSAPFNLSYGGIDRNLDDVANDRLNFSGDVNEIVRREPGSSFPAALAAQFSLQPIGARSGNLPRNAGKGPSFFLFDLNISREWKLSDRMRLRPNAEIGNVFNAVVYSYGSAFIDFESFAANASAAQKLNFEKDFLVTTRTYRARQVRLGIRFDF